jgi:hypothetical protein
MNTLSCQQHTPVDHAGGALEHIVLVGFLQLMDYLLGQQGSWGNDGAYNAMSGRQARGKPSIVANCQGCMQQPSQPNHDALFAKTLSCSCLLVSICPLLQPLTKGLLLQLSGCIVVAQQRLNLQKARMTESLSDSCSPSHCDDQRKASATYM